MFLLFSLLLSVSHAQECSIAHHHFMQQQELDEKQYPEDRRYTSRDRGFRQYGAPSTHGQGRFALTFDDGPHPVHTGMILDVLKAYNVKATFFVLTSLINNTTRPVVKRILQEGHILASHGVEHLNSNTLTEAAFKKNLKDSFIELKDIYREAGVDFDKFYFRYPYAAYGTRSEYHHMNVLQTVSQELFGDNCIQFAFWDIDTGDWVENMTSADITQTLKAMWEGGLYYEFESYRDAQNRLRYRKVPRRTTAPIKGGVVLQHDIHLKNVEGTRQYLEYARENGLELTTLPEIEEFKVLRECRFVE